MGVAQIVAFFATALDASWAVAIQQTANYLGGLAAVTAASNITPSAVQRVRNRLVRQRERPRRV
jgi:predicted histidine transporter YuiF (NhaC family)